MTAALNVDTIKTQLSGETVLEKYNPKQLRNGRRQGLCYRLAACPLCGVESPRGAVVVYRKRDEWKWRHHGMDCGGSMIDLVAAFEGERDIGKAIALAAAMAGVDPMNEPTEVEREAKRIARQVEIEREDQRRLRDARWHAAGDWHRLIRGRSNSAAMDYLRGRSLRPRPLIEDGYIRFDNYGNIAVPLYAFDGELVNVVRRRITPGEPKVFGLKDCPTAGTLSGRVQEITSASTIVVEGVIDALTAIQRWPGRTVLGAHGAGQLRAVVEAAAPRVVAAGGKLVLVPDRDDVGQRQAYRAGEAAIAAGLVMDRTLLVVDVAPHHDLNEAHCKGWAL